MKCKGNFPHEIKNKKWSPKDQLAEDRQLGPSLSASGPLRFPREFPGLGSLSMPLPQPQRGGPLIDMQKEVRIFNSIFLFH